MDHVRPRRLLRRLSLAAAVAVLATPALVAEAHSGAAELRVVLERIAGNEVTSEVAVIHVLDGHPGTPATFTAQLRRDGADLGDPVDLTPGSVEGEYVAELTVPGPGEYTVVFTSTLPPGSLTQPLTVVDLGTPSSGPDTAPTSDADPGDPVEDTTGPEGSSRADDGAPVVLWLGLIGSLVVAGGVVAGFVVWRRTPREAE